MDKRHPNTLFPSNSDDYDSWRAAQELNHEAFPSESDEHDSWRAAQELLSHDPFLSENENSNNVRSVRLATVVLGSQRSHKK